MVANRHCLAWQPYTQSDASMQTVRRVARPETRSACRDAHDAACMPSTWLQKTRRVPCLTLPCRSLSSCCCLCAARALATSPAHYCYPDARLLRTLGLHCASPYSWYTASGLKLIQTLRNPPPPPTSPPRLRPLAATLVLVRSQTSQDISLELGGASRRGQRVGRQVAAHRRKVQTWRYEAPVAGRPSTLVLQEASPVWRSLLVSRVVTRVVTITVEQVIIVSSRVVGKRLGQPGVILSACCNC